MVGLSTGEGLQAEKYGIKQTFPLSFTQDKDQMKSRLDSIHFENRFMSKNYDLNLNQLDKLKKVSRHMLIMSKIFAL